MTKYACCSNKFIKKFIDIDVAALFLCLMEFICRFDSCYLHQNRFLGRSLCYIDNMASDLSALADVVALHKYLLILAITGCIIIT
jgi:hypothetical protein